jgi:hypothetical protein
LGSSPAYGNELSAGGFAIRRRKLIAVLAVLAVVAAVAVALRPEPSRITRENVARVRPGMTRAEVVAILGPPDDYSSGPVRIVPGSPIVDPQKWDGLTWEWWLTDTGLAKAAFDRQGRVVRVDYDPCERIPQGFF